MLNKRSIGCIIARKLVNYLIMYLMYADDLVLIAPSSGGIQQLLDIFYELGLSNDVCTYCIGHSVKYGSWFNELRTNIAHVRLCLLSQPAFGLGHGRGVLGKAWE